MEQDTFLAQTTHYFILTAAGKPVFSLHGSEKQLAEYGGIIQALVSYMEGDNLTLRTFRAKDTLFVAKIEFPLILLAIDKLGQSEVQLRSHLDILHAQILSTLTQSQLAKAFTNKPGIDLRPLLGGTEVFSRALAKDMVAGAPGLWLSALESLTLKKSVRTQINNILLENKAGNLLYGLIISDNRLVSVVRPKRHSLHPPDLYLIFSMLFNTTAFNEGEHWVPICLPKFNPSGFLYAYINFIAASTALVLMSPDRVSFFEMQQMGEKVVSKLVKDDLLDPVIVATHVDRPRPADIGAPLVQHFAYKSRQNVQFIQSSFSPYFETEEERRSLMLSYRQHQAFMQENNLRICHSNLGTKTVFGWITPTFELYCLTGTITKDSLSQSVREIIGWIHRHDARLFITAGATF